MSDLPDLDPRMPGIYRAILDAAQETRERRWRENDAQRRAMAKLAFIRMRAVTSRFDSELDREIVQSGKVRRSIGRRVVPGEENTENLPGG